MVKNLSPENENLSIIDVTGHVSTEDYENVIMPTLEAQHEKYGKINAVYVLDTKISDYSLGALWDDAVIGMKLLRSWNRVALVSDNHSLNATLDFFSKFIPGECRGFMKDDLEEAIEWAKAEA